MHTHQTVDTSEATATEFNNVTDSLTLHVELNAANQ